MTTPQEVLDRLQRYLSRVFESGTLELSRATRDGRVNSQDNERQISSALQYFSISNEWFKANNLQLELAPPRHWYDFSIRDGSALYLPVNVKVSTLRSADNVSSKEGLFHALTGVDPNSVSINSWERFCEQLAASLGTTPAADYYFLVVSKQTPIEVFWTSLKRIRELVPNGNNPPFQCNWGRNRVRIDRSPEEAQRYILNILRETFRLRAEALVSFDRHLNNLR